MAQIYFKVKHKNVECTTDGWTHKLCMNSSPQHLYTYLRLSLLNVFQLSMNLHKYFNDKLS